MSVKKLLTKEFKLALHPTNIFFVFLALMLMIPNYPYLVVMFYTCLGIFFLCQSGRENNDVFFTLMLPVRKRRVVLARILTACILELMQIAVCIPVSVIKSRLNMPANAADIEANTAFFGLSFILFGLFNLVFFTGYYKNVKRVGVPFLLGSVAVFMFIAAEIVLCHALPLFRDKLDTPDPQFLTLKLAVLAIGIAAWLLLTLIAYKRSAVLFEKQDI